MIKFLIILLILSDTGRPFSLFSRLRSKINQQNNRKTASKAKSEDTALTPPKCTSANGGLLSGKPFEKPGDCNNFYQCSNGYLHIIPCAPGTAFNPAVGVCDWPHKVPGCGAPKVPPTILDVPYDSECVDAMDNPLNGNSFEIPGECEKFHRCSKGFLKTILCAPNKVFNPDIKVCDTPENVPGCSMTIPPTNPPKIEQPLLAAPKKPTTFDAKCTAANGGLISGKPFEKPGDCNNFYQCSNGYLHTMPCAPGTAFNPAVGVCDWPHKVPGCGGPKVPPTILDVPYDSECVDAMGNPLNGNSFEIPGECEKFHQCLKGILKTIMCSSDMVFNPDIKVCDTPENVPGCSMTIPPTNPPKIEQPLPAAPKKPTTFDAKCTAANGGLISGKPFEKPGDCNKYYKCSNGYLHTMPCAPGTAFNPAVGVCDWPHKVFGCSGRTVPPTILDVLYDNECVDAAGLPVRDFRFEKPGDGSNFYQCSDGFLHTIPCASGTLFNPALGNCDFPVNASESFAITAQPTTATTILSTNSTVESAILLTRDSISPSEGNQTIASKIISCNDSSQDPSCSNQTTESKQRICPSTWTLWYNTNHPSPANTSGDFELISEIKKNLGPICSSVTSKIIKAECVCEGTGQDWKTAGDIMKCDAKEGLQCYNAKQEKGYACLDYKIRFLCLSKCR